MTRHSWDRRRLAAPLVACVITAAIAAAQAPAATAPPAISADALMATVRTLASKEYQGRAAGTEGNAKARALIRQRFEALKLQPIGTSFEHQFAYTPRQRGPGGGQAQPGTGVNVIGRCAGTDSSLPAIVLSAHYDHLGVRDGQLYPGADDNASGTAAMLELAAQCTAAPLRHDLVIAAFDAEEGGLNGARAFVASGLVPKDRIAVNVNLDMVARGDKGEIYIAGTQHSPALKALLEPVAAKAAVRVRFGHDQPGTGDNDWTLQSDHGEFHKTGVPFVYFGVEDHPDYHQPTDTADKITPDFFVKAVSMIGDALRALDAGLK
jgi:Zn-dependent M28 family amino/carboxypeptidase